MEQSLLQVFFCGKANPSQIRHTCCDGSALGLVFHTRSGICVGASLTGVATTGLADTQEWNHLLAIHRQRPTVRDRQYRRTLILSCRVGSERDRSVGRSFDPFCCSGFTQASIVNLFHLSVGSPARGLSFVVRQISGQCANPCDS